MRDIGKGPWRKGPPPSVGWWPADYGLKCIDILRWYNGEQWSLGVPPMSNVDEITKAVNDMKWVSFSVHDVCWRDRADWWPERSRT